MSTQLCAAALAFLAFAISMIIGLYVDNPFPTVVVRSILMMFVFFMLGAVLSLIGQKVIRENFDAEADTLIADAQQSGADDDVVAEVSEQGSVEQPVSPSPTAAQAQVSN